MPTVASAGQPPRTQISISNGTDVQQAHLGPWDMPLGHGLGHILPIVQNASAASTLDSRVLPFHPRGHLPGSQKSTPVITGNYR